MLQFCSGVLWLLIDMLIMKCRKDTKSKFLIDERPQHSRTCSEKEPCKAKVEKHTGTAEKDDENYISCKPQLGSEPSTQNDWKSPIVAIPEDVYNNYTGIPRRILDKDGNPSPDLTCLNQICQKLKVKLRTSKDSEEMELRVVGIPAKKDSDVLIMGMPDFEYGKEVEWWIKA